MIYAIQTFLKANLSQTKSIDINILNLDVDKSIGVFEKDSKERVCIGGLSSYQVKDVEIRVLWTKNNKTANKKVEELISFLQQSKNIAIEDCKFLFIQTFEPKFLGRSKNQNMVYAIPCKFYYERNN